VKNEKEIKSLRAQVEEQAREIESRVWQEASDTMLDWTYFPYEGNNGRTLRKKYAEHFKAKSEAVLKGEGDGDADKRRI